MPAPLDHDVLVDENDRRRKNVDSGKVLIMYLVIITRDHYVSLVYDYCPTAVQVAIIYSSDSFTCFSEKWSGTSKVIAHYEFII